MQLKVDQNDVTVLYRFEFPNGLTVVLLSSPLSPEAGREVLGAFTEDYTLIGLLQPAGKTYPILRDVRISEAYIREVLACEPPVSSLLFELMPQLTSLDVPDLIEARAERWYSNYYSFIQGELPNA